MLKAATVVGAPRILGTIGCPVIFPSSGTIGNNGALSALTALPRTYANCFMYFPANAIAAGVAAGLYYVVMSSTTAGTIYNNTYTSGMPVIPTTPTAFATTGPGAYTQTTGAAIAIYTLAIQGGIIGANGSFWGNLLISNSGTTNNKTMSANYGGTAITSVVQATAANIAAEWQVSFSNTGVQNAQVFGPVSQIGHGVSTLPNVTGAVDSSVSQNFTFTVNLATATDFVALDYINLVAFPG
jgi:hypothetical protein